MPDIDEAELLRLRKLETQVGALLSSPSARKKLAAAVKEVSPDDKLAKEADAVDPIDARFAALQGELAAEKTARVAAEAKREQDVKLAALSRLRADGIAALRRDQWTDAGIQAVEKLMEEKGILDPLDAAAIYEKAHPPQMPLNPASGTGGYNFITPPVDPQHKTDLDALIESKGENVQLVDKIAWDAIQEVRGASPRR